jgi:hypothetical protein
VGLPTFNLFATHIQFDAHIIGAILQVVPQAIEEVTQVLAQTIGAILQVAAENTGAHAVPTKEGLLADAKLLGAQPHNANELQEVVPSLTITYDLFAIVFI